jgi:hypothetical protein
MPLSWNSMSRVAALCAVFAVALAGACRPAAAAGTPEPAVAAAIDADEIVADHPQVEWAEAYLQWIAAFTHDSSPIADPSGTLCAAKQDGDVWFLATSDGTAPVVRTCSIAAGKWLFVPIVSTVERSGNREPRCESMARIAAGTITGHVSRLSLVIDGRPVDDLASHRLATGTCFSLGLRQTPRLTAATAVSDGYYVMLKPLAPGAHTVVVGAKFDSTPISTTYRLDVH